MFKPSAVHPIPTIPDVPLHHQSGSGSGNEQWGQATRPMLDDVVPPVAEQKNSDIALISALRRLRTNMMEIVAKNVVTPHELRSLLDEQREIEETFDNLTHAIVTSIFKIVDVLARFLSPYLKSIIVSISKLKAKLIGNEDSRLSNVTSRLVQIWEKLAASIPLRLLIPAIEQSYTDLVKEDAIDGIDPLMQLLSTSFNAIQTSESELSDFFLSALQFRCDNASGAKFLPGPSTSPRSTSSRAFVVLILKPSESTFRPLYYKVFEWANRDSSTNDRAITFFNLSSHAADALKHLFVLFASELIDNAVKLLDATNAAKTDFNLFFPDPHKTAAPSSGYILLHPPAASSSTTTKISSTRCASTPYSNPSPTDHEDSEIRRLVIDCLAQLAVAVADDTLWHCLRWMRARTLRARSAKTLPRCCRKRFLPGGTARGRESAGGEGGAEDDSGGGEGDGEPLQKYL
ncbi:hypothetical protein quinque_008047 [Culex quinquefasciatus]